MNQLNKVTLAAAFVAASLCMSGSAVYAYDLNFDSKINALHNKVSADLRAGRLSHAEAVELRQKLDNLATREANFDDNGYNLSERNFLLSELDEISDQLDGFSSAVTVETGAGLRARMNRIDAKISTNVGAGEITRMEAQSLRRDLASVSSRINDGLSPGERGALMEELDRISNRLDRLIASDYSSSGSWSQIQTQQARLRDRIDNAMANRQISNFRGRSLRSELNEISRSAFMARSSGGFLTKAEAAMLKSRQFELNRKISTEIAASGRRWY